MNSGRGGLREGAGRPGGWNHKATKMVRVPIALENQILDFARKLDSGAAIEPDTDSKIEPDTDSTRERLEAIALQVLTDATVTRGGKDRGSTRRALTAFIEQILNNC